MKKRKTFIAALFIIICGNILSQTGKKLDENEKKIFEQKIIEQSEKIITLQCDFLQEKTSVLLSEKAGAKGVLLYQAPNKLRWEYTEPTPLILILNENNVSLRSENGQKTGDERMLKQLGSIIISMINGNGITQNKQFSTDYYKMDNELILVVLTPVQKRLKDFYNKIELKIDQKTMLANEIVLDEKTGDKMTIILSNKVLNAELLQNKFEVK